MATSYYNFGGYLYPNSVVLSAPTEMNGKLRLSDPVGWPGQYSQGGLMAARRQTLTGTLIAESGGTSIEALEDAFYAAHAPGAPKALYVWRDDRYLLAEVESVRVSRDNLVDSADWEVGFVCADPFWYAATASSASFTAI